jgi:hypothetical protein
MVQFFTPHLDSLATTRATVDPRPVAAVATAPWPRRAVAAVPQSEVVAAVASRSRGRATTGPLCGGGILEPRGGDTSKADEQAVPLDVRVATATHEAWGSSGVTEGTRCAQRRSRVTSSNPVQLGGPSNDLHLCLCHWRHPPVTNSSDSCFLFDYCVLCLPHILFMLKTVRFYPWTRNSYISLLHANSKDNSLIYAVCNYHKKSNQIIYVRKCYLYVCHKNVPNSRMFVIIIKNQINSPIFVNARFLRLS